MASQLRASRVPIIAIYLLSLGLFLFFFLHLLSGRAHAANPQLMNFQGKVVNDDGTNVSNGNYDFDFILYDDPTAGTNRWQEGWTSGTSQVTVTNGVFQVALGTHVALPNFNTYPNLYLAVKFNNDAAGYMTPRVRLTSVPYALNSDTLGGIGSSGFVQNQNGSQQSTSNFWISGTGRADTSLQSPILDTATTAALGIGSSNATAITIGNVTNSTVIVKTKTDGTAFQVQDSAGASLLNADSTARSVSGGNVIKVGNSTGTDGDTTIFIVDHATAVPTSNLSVLNGGLFYNSTSHKLSIVENGAVKVLCNTTDAGCGTGGGGDLQSAYNADSSGTADIVTTSSAKTILFKAGSGFDAAALFDIQNAAGSSLLTADSAGFNLGLLEDNSGSLQSWASTSFINSGGAQARTEHSSITANGYLYVIGGENSPGGTEQTSVYYVKIQTDGTIGSWASTTALPQARSGHTSVVANGYVYVIGGRNSSNAAQSTIYYAELKPDGTVGAWNTTSSIDVSGDEPRRSHTSVVANGYLYVIGGVDGTSSVRDTVYYAKLNSDGTVGSWASTTAINVSGSQIRFRHTSVVANGFIYVIGGSNGTSSQDTVYYASLSSNGTVGSWASTTAINVSGSQPRVGHSSVIANGYVYVIGGDNAGDQSTVYAAKLNINGTIGSWASTTAINVSGSQPRTFHTSVIYNGYVYVIGGKNGGTGQWTVYYSSVSRVKLGAILDLVGLQGGTLVDPGDLGIGSMGGAIIAGDITSVGNLRIQGLAWFTRDVSIANNLTVAGGFSLIGNARHDRRVSLVPEYPGATLSHDNDSSNSGTMTSDFCSGTSLRSINTTVCGASEEHNYYSWTASSGANDYDIWVRYQLPSDFSAMSSSTSIQMYGWRTDGTTNAVNLSVFQANGTQCGSTTSVATGTAAWTETAMTGDETTCALSAGDVITFRVNLEVDGSDFVRAGEIRFNYLSKW